MFVELSVGPSYRYSEFTKTSSTASMVQPTVSDLQLIKVYCTSVLLAQPVITRTTCDYLTLRLPSAGDPAKKNCNHVPSAGDPARTLHEKWCRQPGVRLERYMKIGAVSRGPGYTHRPCV